jgi:hypothetical protein
MAISKITTNSITDDAVTTAKVNPAQTDITSVGTLTSATVSGALSAKGGAVFNEDSADVDFRVESNGNANMINVDGGNDRVGIGISPSFNTQIDKSSTNTTLTDLTDAQLVLSNTGSATTNQHVKLGFRFQDGSVNGQAMIAAVRESSSERSAALILSTAPSSDGDPDERMRITSDGHVTIASQPSISADGNSTSQLTFDSANRTMTEFTTSGNSEFYSQGITFDSSNGRFTVPIAGKYLINSSVYTYSNSVFQRLQVAVNGSVRVHYSFDNTTGDGDLGQDNSLTGSTILNLAASDYVQFIMYHGSGTKKVLANSAHTHVSLHKLS